MEAEHVTLCTIAEGDAYSSIYLKALRTYPLSMFPDAHIHRNQLPAMRLGKVLRVVENIPAMLFPVVPILFLGKAVWRTLPSPVKPIRLAVDVASLVGLMTRIIPLIPIALSPVVFKSATNLNIPIGPDR